MTENWLLQLGPWADFKIVDCGRRERLSLSSNTTFDLPLSRAEVLSRNRLAMSSRALVNWDSEVGAADPVIF